MDLLQFSIEYGKYEPWWYLHPLDKNHGWSLDTTAVIPITGSDLVIQFGDEKIAEELISKFGDMNSLVQTAHNGGIQLKDLIASIQTDLPLIETTITSAKTTITSLESFMDN